MSVPISFAQFLVSLGSSAMVHLGETPDPATGALTAKAQMALHTLDVLRLLKAKTAGKLYKDEQRLIDALIEEISTKLDALKA